jgi:hypothetical protein
MEYDNQIIRYQMGKKRERLRLALRNNDILPPYGYELTPEQLLINVRISNNDFSVMDELRLSGRITKPMSPYKKVIPYKEKEIKLLILRLIQLLLY